MGLDSYIVLYFLVNVGLRLTLGFLTALNYYSKRKKIGNETYLSNGRIQFTEEEFAQPLSSQNEKNPMPFVHCKLI